MRRAWRALHGKGMEKERDVRERDIGQAICSKCDQAWLRGNIIFFKGSRALSAPSAVPFPAAPSVFCHVRSSSGYSFLLLSLRFRFCGRPSR